MKKTDVALRAQIQDMYYAAENAIFMDAGYRNYLQIEIFKNLREKGVIPSEDLEVPYQTKSRVTFDKVPLFYAASILAPECMKASVIVHRFFE